MPEGVKPLNSIGAVGLVITPDASKVRTCGPGAPLPVPSCWSPTKLYTCQVLVGGVPAAAVSRT